MKVLQKIRLPHDPENPLLDTYWEKAVNSKDNALLYTMPKMWKQPKCPLPNG